jgi:serine beta-lactamase-like protein LACTB
MDQREAVDQAVMAQMHKQGLVGLSIGIIEEGEVAYTAGYGFANRDDKTPVDANTLYRWASISKPLTAVAAMQLVETGSLDLDADVRTFVPEFPDHGVAISTRQVLGHLGGIVHYRNGPVVLTETVSSEPHPHADVIKALDTFKASPLVSKPGVAFNYSTHGFMLASAVVQRAGGQPFAKQVQARIAAPLGMTTLQPDYQWVDNPHRATGYRKVIGMIVESPDADVSWKLGGGGWMSTIGDIATFAAALMGDQLLSKHARNVLWSEQDEADGTGTGYGLGFGCSGTGNALTVSHTGAQAKTRTVLSIEPLNGRGIVLMSNTEWIDRGNVIAALRQALHSVHAEAAPAEVH